MNEEALKKMLNNYRTTTICRVQRHRCCPSEAHEYCTSNTYTPAAVFLVEISSVSAPLATEPLHATCSRPSISTKRAVTSVSSVTSSSSVSASLAGLGETPFIANDGVVAKNRRVPPRPFKPRIRTWLVVMVWIESGKATPPTMSESKRSVVTLSLPSSPRNFKRSTGSFSF